MPRAVLAPTGSKRWRVPWTGLLLVCLFISQLFAAAVLHLNTAVARRSIEGWVSRYLSTKLRGTLDLGQLESLSTTRFVLRNAIIYDEHHRRVATINRIFAESDLFGALYRFSTKNEALTLIVGSVRADGVHLRLHPASLEGSLSLLEALEPTPEPNASKGPVSPYRVFLANVEVGDITVDSTLSGFVTNSLQLQRVAGQALFTQRGVAASVKRFNLKFQDAAAGAIQAFGNLEFRSPDRLWGDVNAVLGAVSGSLHLDYRAATLDLRVHPFKITPTAARQWWPEWPLQPTLVASLSARGPLNELGVRWNVNAENAELEGVGRLSLVGQLSADLAILARSLDVKSLFGAPVPSSLDAAGRLSLSLHDSQPTLRFDGLIHPGYVGGVVTPRIDIDGQLDAQGLVIGGRSNDRRLPIRAAILLKREQLDIDAQLDRASLEQLVPRGVAVQGLVGARARAQIKGDAITSELEVTLKGVRAATAKVGTASLRTEFRGPLALPKEWSGSLDLNADRVQLVPGLVFDRVTSRVVGGAESAKIQVLAERPGVAKVSLQSTLHALRGPALDATRLELIRGQRTLLLTLGGVSIDQQTLVLDRLSLDGSAGKATGTLALSPEYAFGQVSGSSIDLAAVAEVVGLPQASVSGSAAFELDVDTRRRPAHGSFRLALDQVSLGPLKQITGQVEGVLAERELKVSSSFASSLVEQVDASADLLLDGPATTISSYQHATGKITLDLNGVRLDQALTQFAPVTVISNVSGAANVRLAVNRAKISEQPSWTLSAVTHAFEATLSRADKTVRVAGLDWLFSADFRGDRGALRSDLVLYRDNQPKLTLNALATMPAMHQWLNSDYQAGFDWQEIPFEAFVTIPRQPLTDWRDPLGLDLGRGTIETKLWIRGPVNSMSLAGEAHGNDLVLPALDNAPPLNIEGLVEHSPAQTRLLISAGSGQSTWLQLNAMVQLIPCASRLLCFDDWNGRAELGLLGLPLGNVPRLSDLGVTGEVRGALSAQREAGQTRVNGVLPVNDLRISGQALGQAVLHVLSDEAELVAGAKLLDANAQINLEAHLPMRWHDALPRLHEVAPIRVVADATGYDAAVLRPWLNETISDLGGELSGRLDATFRSSEFTALASSNVDAGPQQSVAPQIALSGYLTLNHGHGYLRSLGLSFADLAIAAQAASTGDRTTISVPTISASTGPLQNNLNASAVIELEALSLKRLTAHVGRAKDVPVSINSADIATLSGAANVEVTRAPSGFDVSVEFEDLELFLLRNSARQVVGLTENPDVLVLQPLGPDDWQQARVRSPTELRVRLSLGGRARIKRADFNIPVTGAPEIAIGAKLRPSGTVYLGSTGRLELLGKSFVIDRGQVTLDPDHPSNPQFDVTATWRGPTHLVTAQLRGTLEDAKLRLSSDPPLPSEARVMALLIGGGSGNDSTAGAGLGVGATLFNELLSDTALSSVEVRTSSGDQHANYTAAVPLRENLWFEATYQSPTNTTMPGTSVQRGFSGTVDYRFRRNWSVRTEVGTLGAGADLLWQYRY